jgi:signal transduction histidine kinase
MIRDSLVDAMQASDIAEMNTQMGNQILKNMLKDKEDEAMRLKLLHAQQEAEMEQERAANEHLKVTNQQLELDKLRSAKDLEHLNSERQRILLQTELKDAKYHDRIVTITAVTALIILIGVFLTLMHHRKMLRRIKKQNVMLKVARDQANSANNMKTAFIHNMSHEIRTPLNAIVGFSELLQYSEDPSERKEYMDVINANNKLLLHLMNDVLDLSRIEAGDVKLDLETFDAARVREEIYATVNESRTNTEVEFNYVSQFSSCEVTLDRSRFRQVVTNFLSNAMKFTHSGSVTLSLEESDGGVRVSVKDTGVGVEKEKQHLLFQRFEKIDSYAPGYGLGLSISKAVTEAMGGNVGFTSVRGVGSTFYAWFPYNIATSIRNEDKSPCPVGEIE